MAHIDTLNQNLTNNRMIGYAFSLIRVYYGYLWFIAGYNKLTSDFIIVGFFNYFVLSEHSIVQFQAAKGEWGASIWLWFVESLFIPLAPMLNIFIPVLEVFIGILLIIGYYRVLICYVACFLNFTFIMSGVVWPGIHFVFFQLLIAYSKNAHEISLDNYLIWRREQALIHQ
ncbi:hypothetical protein ACQKP3_17380 [Vibrio sp. DNB22_10_4]